MRVYSLKTNPGDIRHGQAIQCDYWFWQRGYEVIPFHAEQLHEGDLDNDLIRNIDETIVYGSVGIVRDAIRRAGRPDPKNLDFPDELQTFVGRAISESTMGEIQLLAQRKSDRLPVHIKPRDQHKLFTGKVIHTFRDLIALSGIPSEQPIIVQEVVKMTSEWRASILRGKVLNIAHYSGNGLQFPDPELITQAVAAFASAPIGYSTDWAVTEDGRTVLIEVNDGFALGNYGLSGHLYTALIECRWRELMGLQDNGVGIEN